LPLFVYTYHLDYTKVYTNGLDRDGNKLRKWQVLVRQNKCDVIRQFTSQKDWYRGLCPRCNHQIPRNKRVFKPLIWRLCYGYYEQAQNRNDHPL